MSGGVNHYRGRFVILGTGKSPYGQTRLLIQTRPQGNIPPKKLRCGNVPLETSAFLGDRDVLLETSLSLG